MQVTLPTWLDFVVLGVMLVSGLLAMIRGFMREILSIAGWIAAAVGAYFFAPRLVPAVQDYLHSEIIAKVAAVGGVFLITLIVATVITSRISDLVLDSRIGALDRTLGFLFGLGRGLLILVVAYAFFAFLVPPKGQPEGITNAKSLSFLKGSSEWLQSLLPEGILDTISKKINKGKPDDDQTDAAPDYRSSSTASIGNADGGYGKPERDGLRRLIEGKPISGR
jgi:membrane protein required for colicin V production